MADYLESKPRRQLWYAIMAIPKELRGVNNLPNLRFIKSTGTGDRRQARIIASQFVAGWLVQIEQAKGNDTSVISRAMQWKEEFEKTEGEQRDILESLIADEAEKVQDATGSEAQGIEFYQIATGAKTLTESYFKQWKAQLNLTPRTIEQYSKDVKLFIEKFPVVDSVNKGDVSLWLDTLSAKSVTKDTQKRIIKGCRNYWKYLSRYNIKGMVEEPFHGVILADKGKKKAPREPFEPTEVVELWQMAKSNKDNVLADLILLGAYTGARIEELCGLMVKDVTEDVFNIIDSKTSAGNRSVPIHSHLKLVIKRLKDDSKDAYLLPELTLDKYGDRSPAMSSRFSKLKVKAGHGRLKVFHSLRHSLVTALVNAGVQEFHIADIVGHEKKGITGKVYSHTIPLEVKQDAIEKVKYSFPELT